MYGLANQGIKDLVLIKFGDEAWSKICAEAKIPTTDFVSLQMYPDQITYALVGAASKILGFPAPDVLRTFGKHWIQYTAREGYGPMMDLFGANFSDCLKNLNALHSRMGMTLPGLKPPNFIFTKKNDDEFELEYQSSRPGLCPMVQGLLEGLAEKYGLSIDLLLKTENNRNIFMIKSAPIQKKAS